MGYDENFIAKQTVTCPKLPDKELRKFKDADLDPDNFYLDYINYSVLQNPFRKFPYYSAANIDGKKFQKEGVTRKDYWKKDDRICKKYQFGHELYKAENDSFDRGHMTKREDVQWGTMHKAQDAADKTFFFTNAVPQHANLNRTIWRFIEDYILHTETVVNKLKITVFTGPVFHNKDPFYKISIDTEKVRLPVVFWKVIYYLNSNLELFRTAFLVNQAYLLKEDGIVEDVKRDKIKKKLVQDYFQEFTESETYQTNVSLIERLTGLTFLKAKESHNDKRPTELILNNVNVRSNELFEDTSTISSKTKITNICL